LRSTLLPSRSIFRWIHLVGELGRNLEPSKLRRYQDSDEFIETGREDPRKDYTLAISKKFANPQLLSETIAE
jgi:hypothetical protein